MSTDYSPEGPGSPARRRAAAAAVVMTLAGLAAPGLSAAGGKTPEPEAAAAAAAGSPALTTVERWVTQDQGGWVVDYRLRYRGPSAAAAVPSDLAVKLEGWVSNSRVAAHALPRFSALTAAGPTGLCGMAEVVHSADELQRCRERLVARAWADEAPAPPEAEAPGNALAHSPTQAAPSAALDLFPGAVVRLRLRLHHDHILYGEYDPLLGVRSLEVRLGPASFRDALPLDHEHYLARPKSAWPAPPEDRRDARHFVSAPDSLHLEAHVPGNQHYRYPDRPVRYATRMRLRYWYYIAAGGEGDYRARIFQYRDAQYRDSTTAWKALAEGSHEEALTAVGRWVKVERVFRTEPEATSLALDFRIGNADVGEMWVDDVTLEPVDAPAPGGP